MGSSSPPPLPPDTPPSSLDYAQHLDAAMEYFLRQVLAQVAEYGFPGEHHLYISFRTTLPGVELSSSLRRQYPHEMRIVLQLRFEKLIVNKNTFAVTLDFSGRPERIVVPFSSITEFTDPSVADVRYYFARYLDLDADAANLGEGTEGAVSSPTEVPPKVVVQEDTKPLPGDERAAVVELEKYRARRNMRPSPPSPQPPSSSPSSPPSSPSSPPSSPPKDPA
ncbi:MAG: ClpXP protease specificity-enhancing factor SspB [Alphaproteobacteria bacterium]